jgi:hypothetical protein
MTTAITLAPELSLKAAAIRNSLNGLGSLVELRPDTLALIERGLSVQHMLDAVATDLEVAECLEVDSPDMLAEAQAIAGRIAALSADTGAIEKERKALTAPFNDIVKAINAGYTALRTHLNGVRSQHLDPKILAWNREQLRLARAAEEAARLKREAEAAAIAAAERASREQSERLLAQAKAAQEQGDAAAAQALVSEASTAADAGRQAANEAVRSLHVRPTTFEPVKAKGVRESWSAEVGDIEALICHVADRIRAGDHSQTTLLEANQSALTNKAKVEKAGFNVPGVRAVVTDSLSTRKAAIAA